MLVSVALTNEPNIRGGRPIANREPAANRGGEAKKYRWVLGNPPSGEHCGECLARAGQVKTAPEWAANARLRPAEGWSDERYSAKERQQ